MDIPPAIRPGSANDAPVLLGRDPELARALGVAERLARTDQPVLLVGETGTGKDLVARLVHRASPRAEEASGELAGHLRASRTSLFSRTHSATARVWRSGSSARRSMPSGVVL